MSEAEFSTQMIEDVWSYIELAIQYQEELTVKNFIEHLKDKYSDN